MKKILVALVVTLGLLAVAPVTVTAQTYLRTTTLSTSITSTQTTFAVASATGVAAGGALFVDAEFMPISAVSGTSVTVVRAQRPIAHAASAVVIVASAAAKAYTMLTHSAAYRIGQCSTSTSVVAATALAGFSYLPIIDIDTGDMYMCRHNGVGGSWVWNRTNVQNINGTAGSVPTSWP